jgi:hypothetical protein
MGIVDELQNELSKTNIDDFRVLKFTQEREGTLTIAGSFDFCYYHEIEINFYGTSYISCPTSFNNARFRMASELEIRLLKDKIYDDCGEYVVCIVVDEIYGMTKEYFIVANGLDYAFGTVFYYEREVLKEGEKIADWVK